MYKYYRNIMRNNRDRNQNNSNHVSNIPNKNIVYGVNA